MNEVIVHAAGEHFVVSCPNNLTIEPIFIGLNSAAGTWQAYWFSDSNPILESPTGVPATELIGWAVLNLMTRTSPVYAGFSDDSSEEYMCDTCGQSECEHFADEYNLKPQRPQSRTVV